MHALEVKNIVKSYSNHVALNDVSLNIPQGSIFGLLGPNGAGKTTLIRIINQIIGPDSGKIKLNGKALSISDQSIIGYLPEERGLYRKMKVGEQSMYLAMLKGMSSSEAKAALKSWFDKFEIHSWWDKKIEELSKGMAQKVQFITTVVHNPKLIILDEPFSGFDPINVELIRNEIIRLKNEGATIILSTHNMGSVEEICDHICLIHEANVVLEGEVDEIRKSYSGSQYDIVFKGNAINFTNILWTNYELLHKVSDGNRHDCRIRILNGEPIHALLKQIINEVEILEVKEYMPTMHEIFIDVVKEKVEDNG